MKIKLMQNFYGTRYFVLMSQNLSVCHLYKWQTKSHRFIDENIDFESENFLSTKKPVVPIWRLVRKIEKKKHIEITSNIVFFCCFML